MRKYLITGGTGLVGSALVDKIKATDSHITILTRQDKYSEDVNIRYVNWSKDGWQAQVPDIDVVINLAGASLSKRWTEDYKRTIMLSRLQSTQTLYELFKDREKQPDVLFNASAVGYYKPDLNRTYTELDQMLPFDFLSEVCYQWEKRARQFEALGTRVVIGRFGMVLAEQGGSLPLMTLPYKLMVGGKLGHGLQWYSWIHLDDLTRAILTLTDDQDAKGVHNMTAPIAERQNFFGYTIGRVMHRPHYTWVPQWMMRLVLGEMSTVVLDTQKVVPNRLIARGFEFQYPNLKMALQNLLQG